MIPEYRRGVRLEAIHVDVEADYRARAVRTVCGLTDVAADAAIVIEALGLDPREGRRVPATTHSGNTIKE